MLLATEIQKLLWGCVVMAGAGISVAGAPASLWDVATMSFTCTSWVFAGPCQPECTPSQQKTLPEPTQLLPPHPSSVTYLASHFFTSVPAPGLFANELPQNTRSWGKKGEFCTEAAQGSEGGRKPQGLARGMAAEG